MSPTLPTLSRRAKEVAPLTSGRLYEGGPTLDMIETAPADGGPHHSWYVPAELRETYLHLVTDANFYYQARRNWESNQVMGSGFGTSLREDARIAARLPVAPDQWGNLSEDAKKWPTDVQDFTAYYVHKSAKDAALQEVYRLKGAETSARIFKDIFECRACGVMSGHQHYVPGLAGATVLCRPCADYADELLTLELRAETIDGQTREQRVRALVAKTPRDRTTAEWTGRAPRV